MWWLKIITILGIFCCTTVIVSAQSSCRTPNGETGRCISIYSCDVLYAAVTTKDSRQISFLRESQCGYDSGPLVCCGSYDNYRTIPTPRRPNPVPSGGGRRGTINNLLPDRSQCGYQSSDRILNGTVTDIDEFPWMALLQYRKRNGDLTFCCGGTLINNKYVLTAAHCVTGRILSKCGTLTNVRLGEWNTDTEEDCINQQGFQVCSDPPVNVGVEQSIPHPDYSDTNVHRYNDIALVRLRQPVTKTEYIRPICLPMPTERTNVGNRLAVAGWGRTENANSSPVKLKLLVPVVAATQCASRFNTAGVNIGSSQLCAGGERGKDSCNGDSGGPLMGVTRASQWYIEGIVSFGAQCGSQGWPGIYTRVTEFLDWISDNVRA